MRLLNQWNQWLIDLRFALRQFRRAPGFTLLVLLTLTLGITATTVIFSLIHAVLLQPLPLPHPEQLVSLQTFERPAGSTGPSTIRNDTSYPNFYDWRSLNKSFLAMAAYNTGGLILAPGGGAVGNNPARRLPAVQVSSDFFPVIGVSPEFGRGFTPAEDMPGTRAVVLSHDIWQSDFAGDRSIVGKSIVLSERSYTVVGIMPRGFAFPVAHGDAFWVNIAPDAEGQHPSTQQRGYNQLNVVARLRPEVSLEQARAEMNAIQQSLAARYPDDDQNETAVGVVPQLEEIVSDVKTPLRILFAAVCCLLLIVCTNVAGLLLTRISQRRGELAIRSALGASRTQIVRQLLLESLVISVSSGILGLLATAALLRIAPSFLPANLPRVGEISMNGQVLAFAIALSALTGLIFGILPAWRASKQDPANALAESSRGSVAGRKHYRLQSILVVAQTAIGLVLLVGSGLLIHSLDRILKSDPGFAPQQMLSFRISVPGKRYTDARQEELFHQLLSDLRALPGVQSASAAFPLPLTQGNISISFSIAGRPSRPGDEPSARVSLIEPSFFETLRVPLIQGRFFLSSEQNEKGRPVVIVNEAFAKRFFPGQNAVGQHITSGLGIGENPPEREIVGVVGTVKRMSLTEPPTPEYYIPFEQAPIATPNVAMRVTGDPSSYANAIRAKIAAIDGTLPIYRFESYNDDIARITSQQRFQTLLLTGFAVVALLLAALGLYAVLSYMVAQRTAELGLRMALGAPRLSVLQLMLFRGLKMAAIGAAAGLVAASLLTRFVATLLYGVKPLDAVTFAGMTLVLLLVSCLASLIPAWRGAMLDPNSALRKF
jgi:predicted permease